MLNTLEPSTLRILRPDGKTVGTGFLVAPRLAVTCAHVVALAEAVDGDTIQAQFTGRDEKIPALVTHWRDVDKGDVAFLRLETVPEGVSPLPLGLAEHSQPGNTFRSFGYATAAKIEGIFANGAIDGYLREHQLVQLQSPQADHGLSGAPVFDEKRGVVMGMITKGDTKLGRNEYTTFATPAEVLFEICPEIHPSETCPYLELKPFSAETAQFFFGRETLTEKLFGVLRGGCRFLAVFGPSGSGKSSVVRAGLLPKLENGLFTGWKQITMRPADAPFAQMQSAGLESFDNLTEQTILFIDQFEELFTLCPDTLREKFVRELAAALENSRFMLIISMRDDFYSVFNAKAAPLASSSHKTIVDVPITLERKDLAAMMEHPAEAVGLALEEGLTELILKDLTRDGEARSSTLPLLEFTLTKLWEQRRDGLLAHKTYQDIGGVTGSLARWADDAYSNLPNKDEQNLAESLLTALVHLGDEAQGLPDTRKRRALTDFDEPTRDVIKHFTDRRLLVTSGETVELVHDSLVREWGRLQDWLKKNRERLRVLETVNEAAKAWRENPKNADLLVHRGGRLEDALKLRGALNTQEQTYLDTCKTAVQRRRQVTIASISFAVLVIMAVLAGWGWSNSEISKQLGFQVATATYAQGFAQQQVETAEAAKATAVGEANARATAQANAEIEKQNAEQQAKIAFARQLAAQAQALFLDGNPKQLTAVLLAIQSMRIFPALEAAQILQNNTLAKLIARITHDSQVTAVAFSPDSKYVVSGSDDGTVRVWEANTGKEIAHMTHNAAVWSVAFSPDGKYVVSGGWDGTARVWEASAQLRFIARVARWYRPRVGGNHRKRDCPHDA